MTPARPGRRLAVIVFARLPVPGRAKTRLVPALGPEGAAALATRMLRHAVAEAMACGAHQVELRFTADGSGAAGQALHEVAPAERPEQAVPPERTAPPEWPEWPAWPARHTRLEDSEPPARAAPRATAGHPLLEALQRDHPGLRLTDQGGGDLGQRMWRALEAALRTHDAAVLLGTDAPALDATRIAEAAAALHAHDAVFVPALDGGYALVGLARPAPQLFEGIAWSTPQVMAQTRERAAASGLALAELAAVADIDEPADLVHVPPAWA